MKIFCGMAQFLELPFFGPHTKPNGVRGLGKHHRVIFDLKLGRVKCAVRFIPCVCMECTNIIDQPWVPGM